MPLIEDERKFSKEFEREERNTLCAINKLSLGGMPYAATVLAYIVIDRILIMFIMMNRKNGKVIDVDKKGKDGKKLGDFENETNKVFYEEFIKLNKIGLGKTWDIIKEFKKDQEIAKTRNDFIHSKLYLGEAYFHELSEDRREKYYTGLRQALKDLKLVLDEFSYIQVDIEEHKIPKIIFLN